MIEVEAATRLMSEIAHDLRSPLTTIRESIRLVSDGSLGTLNGEQLSYLNSAIDQCECMDQMVTELVQLERLRSGLPRVNRRWVSVKEVQAAVEETLRPWAIPRGISVLWDGADDANQSVFADPSMLRRLIVNLATNSIRVSSEGSPVLIRLQTAKGGDSIIWSVIDQGDGIAPADLSRIAQRQVSMGNGEGLGISICRQLAALHASSLSIRSRKGVGTQVSFSTAAAGPSSVAEHWARWRVSQREPSRQPIHRDVHDQGLTAKQGQQRRSIRLDPPSMAIELHAENASPRCADRCAAGTVTLGAAMARNAADDFDRIMQSQLNLYELVYRVDCRRWVWVLDVDDRSVGERIHLITDAAKSAIANLRLRWSDPQMIPIDEKRTANRLSDLLIRQTLAASTSIHATDANQVRLGTSPIEPSNIAAARLEVELSRLGSRLSRQSFELKNQSRNLRPNLE